MTILLLAGIAILILAALGLIANAAGVDSRDLGGDARDDHSVRGSI